MADEDTRPPSLLAIGIGLVLLLVVGWIALSIVFSTTRIVLAYAGYLIVAVVAYQIGKAVGRSSSEP